MSQTENEKTTGQFDPATGRAGDTQLVKRWVLMLQGIVEGELVERHFYPTQGRYTFEYLADANRRAEAFANENTQGHIRQVFSSAFSGCPSLWLRPVQVWCWPDHFDPFVRVPNGQIGKNFYFLS